MRWHLLPVPRKGHRHVAAARLLRNPGIHVSYRQIWDGHGMLESYYILARTTVLMRDPCLLGLPVVFAVAHVGGARNQGRSTGCRNLHKIKIVLSTGLF